MFQPFFSGVNKLSQLSSLIVFSDLLQIHKFRYVFFLRKIENSVYEAWEQQDQVLLTLLQSTLSTSILFRVLGCAYSDEVWERIHDYFHKQTRATARQPRTQLHATSLGGKLMCEFLSQIDWISESLASVKSPIMLQKHIDSIA